MESLSLIDCFWGSHGIQRANPVFSTWKVIPFLWIPEVKMTEYSGFLLLLFPPKGILLTQRYVSLFTSLHICSLWPEEWYYCKTWNLSFSERDSGQSPCASASPRMAWMSASKTDMLVRPACLHSWVVFGDSFGGRGEWRVLVSVQQHHAIQRSLRRADGFNVRVLVSKE